MNELGIRRGEWSDIAACATLMASSEPWLTFRYSVEECLPKIERDDCLRIAEIDGIFAGFASFSSHGIGSNSLLSLVCISSEHRGKGIGRRLIRHVENEVFRYDKNLFLFVSSFNHSAIGFYEHLGYTKVGEIADYNTIGLSELLYRKTTGPKREDNIQS